MSMKEYIPGLGEKKAKKKLKELEDEAGSLAVMFGVFVAKIFESLVAGDIMLALQFAAAAAVTAILHIYGKEAAKAAKETAEEVKEGVDGEK